MPAEKCKFQSLFLPSVSASLGKLLETSDHSDVTLRCQGAHINCHRTILALYSTVFQQMFKDKNLLKASPVVIDIEQSFNFALVKQAVDFIYGKGLTLSGANVKQLLHFADTYKICMIKDGCSDMLLKHVTPVVSFSLWKLADTYNAEELSHGCWKYCVKHFTNDAQHIGKTTEFLAAEKRYVIAVLSDRELNVLNENDAFNAAIAWILHQPTTRIVDLQELISKCIRTERLTAQCVLHELHAARFLHVEDVVRKEMLDFVQKLLSGCIVARTLPARSRTRHIDALACCVQADDRIAVAPLVDSAGNELTLHPDVKPSLLHLPKEIEEPLESSLYLLGSSLVCHDDDADMLHSQFSYTLAGEYYHMHRGDWKRVTLCNSPYMLALADGKVLMVESSDGGVILKKLTDLETWNVDYAHVTPRSALDVLPCRNFTPHTHLIAEYSAYLFLFFPTCSEVFVFETRTGRYACALPLRLTTEWDPCNIAYKNNIACLLYDESIYVVRLDKLLQQVMVRLQESGSGEIVTQRCCTATADERNAPDVSSDAASDDADHSELSDNAAVRDDIKHAANDCNDAGAQVLTQVTSDAENALSQTSGDTGKSTRSCNASELDSERGEHASVCSRNGSDDSSTTASGNDNVVTRLRSSLPLGEMLGHGSAAFYDDRLYMTSKHVDNDNLVLCSLNMQQLLTRADGSVAQWVTHNVSLDASTREHLYARDPRLPPSVQVFATRIENPGFYQQEQTHDLLLYPHIPDEDDF